MTREPTTDEALEEFLSTGSEERVLRLRRWQRGVWFGALALFFAFVLASYAFSASENVKNGIFAAFLVVLAASAALRLKVRRADADALARDTPTIERVADAAEREKRKGP